MARLTLSDRRTLAKMYADEKSVTEIAVKLGCSPQTIYDELRRGRTGQLDKNQRRAYDPNLGQRVVQDSVRHCGKRRRIT